MVKYNFYAIPNGNALKFGGVWILYPEISEFRIYLMKFGSVWILHFNVLKFEFIP